MTEYVVLTRRTDDEAGEQTWNDPTGKPIEAGSPDAAITKLRRSALDFYQQHRDSIEFVAIPVRQFQPKRLRRRLVETYELAPASEADDDPQGTLA